MGNGAKPAYRVVKERLLHWHICMPKSFTLSIDQLAELMKGLEKQSRFDDKQYAEAETLYKHLCLINKGK